MIPAIDRKILIALFAAYTAALAFPGPAQAEVADLSDVPLANSPTDAVLPNLMYILDDSGSMMWDYMPDNVQRTTQGSNMLNCKTASGSSANIAQVQCALGNPGSSDGNTADWAEPPYYSPQFNQIYYNPDVTYAPGVDSTGVSLGNASPTAAKKDAYLNATTVNLTTSYPEVYYCQTATATTVTASISKTTLTVTGVTLGTVAVGQIVDYSGVGANLVITGLGTGTGGNGTYTLNRSSTTSSTTMNLYSAADLANPVLCKRNGVDNLQASPNNYFLYWSNNTTVGTPYGAFPVATGVGATTFNNAIVAYTGHPHYYTITPHEYCSDANLVNCQLANANGSAPSGFSIPAPIRYCGATSDAASTSAVSDAVGTASPKCRKKFDQSNYRYPRYGRFTRTDIVPATTTYTKSATSVRTDCAASGFCTYAEELQNFANWYSYYRVRMAMMKTATGRSFLAIDDRYRVGFITINPGSPVQSATNSPSDVRYVPLAQFNAAQKATWYTTLYKQTNHGSTPLREALSRVGRHYAGVTNGINNGMPEDPVQYSCQQHFALLTTDGYWNDSDTDAVDTSGAQVNNQDNTPDNHAPPFVSRASGTLDALGAQTASSTPSVFTEQAICNANNRPTFTTTACSGTTAPSCSCGGGSTQQLSLFQAVTTQTSLTNASVEGVAVGNSTSCTTTYTRLTPCTTQPIVTTTTPWKVVETQVVAGTQATTFTAAANGSTNATQSAGACAFNQVQTITRVTTSTQTIVTTNGVAASPTYGSLSVSFTSPLPTACTTLPASTTATKVVNTVTETEKIVCSATGSVTFGTGVTGLLSSATRNCSCNSGRSVLITRTVTYKETQVTNSAGPQTPTVTSVSTSFSPSASPVTNTSCSNNPVGGAAAASNNFTASAPSSLTYSGLPQSVVTVSNGANGASNPVNTQSGTVTAVTLTPNPTTVVGTTTIVNTPGGTPNTLADVAMYYYKTDLRTSGSVSADNVPGTPKDFAVTQHMTTFTLGLGLQGNMDYTADYESNPSSDLGKIKSASTGCSFAPGICDWPAPSAGAPSTLDDLWHAAVNGRGVYFSASDPNSLAAGLSGALTALKIELGAASASATSSPNITPTDNAIYSSTFRTVKWDGEIVAQKIDPTTGQIVPAVIWSAQALLDGQTSLATDTRAIWKYDPSGTNKLKSFVFSNLSSSAVGGIAAEQAYFANQCTALSQCPLLTGAQQILANDGSNMVNYLRGQRGNEATLYRLRDHVLGDSVNATPAFVRVPQFGFVDAVTPTYASFKTANASRQGVLYVAGNDGMLHAFNGNTDNTGGVEMWAYVPRIVFPNLKSLASDNWSVTHKYSVDGSPSTMDVFDSGANAWKTILVGGLNKGGRGFYALDVTNPSTPKGMWEICSDSTLCSISDADMGYSYGNPLITKRAADGRWVVMVTSGLNNVSPGNGQGYLYVLDAFTGAILQKIATGAGDTTTPSGFSRIAGFANSFNTDNTSLFVYGGDLLGNVWRFDMSTTPTSYPTVQTAGVLKLAALTDSGGKPQSITTRPELGAVQGFRAVFIGTGRYLGVNDLSDPATLSPSEQWAYQQTFYAIKDNNQTSTYGDLRAAPQLMVQQTLTDTLGVRTSTANAVDWNTKNGWYVDFNPGGSSPGERVSLDPQLVQGTVIVTTAVPNNNACTVGGDSFVYQFDYIKGSYVSTSPGGVVAQKITGQITVGIVVVRLPDGTFKAERTGSGGSHDTVGVNIGTGGGVARRVSWRELFQLQ